MEIERKNNGCNSEDNIEKEKMLVRTVHTDEGGFTFSELFTINLRNRFISESPYVLYNDQGCNSMVSLGSTVYVVGGQELDGIPVNVKPPNSASNNKKGTHHMGMSFLDLDTNTNTNPDECGWKEAPVLEDDPMLLPAVITLGGKIYFFKHEFFAGIFDPVTNMWETFLPPPEVGSFDIFDDSYAVVDPDNNRILVYFPDFECYFAYYPSDKRWERVLDSLPCSDKRQFIVDAVLYSYSPKDRQVFQAFDLATKHYLDIVFTSKVPGRVWKSKFDELMYLGNGYLCLCLAGSSLEPQKRPKVYIAKFRVQRTVDHPGELLITPFPLENYILNTPRSTVESYLPI